MGSSFARGTCIQSSASTDIVHGDKSLFGHFFSCKQSCKHDTDCHLTKSNAHIATSSWTAVEIAGFSERHHMHSQHSMAHP